MGSFKRILFLLLLLIVVTLTTLPILRGQNPNKSIANEQQKDAREKLRRQFPVVDYDNPVLVDSTQREKRRKKSKRYDNAVVPLSPTTEFDTSTIGWARGLSALPVVQSQAVIIGEVKDAQAYLSNDKSAVYSEITIRIEKVILNRSQTVITPKSEITGDRPGGRVKMPAGHEALVWVAGLNMPQVNKRYLFFLKERSPEENFYILAGYELRDGKVYPLDSPSGGTHPLATTYNGTDEATFLTDLQSATLTSLRQ